MEKPKINYELRLGGIEKVLGGKGKSVDSYEDLYFSSDTSDLIFIPKVVGVYQTMESYFSIDEFKKEQDRAVQFAIGQKFGKREEIPGELICVVYDPDSMIEHILRNSVKELDFLKRIKITDYKNIPDFKSKSFTTGCKICNLLGRIGQEKECGPAINLLEREVEYFELNNLNFGLTRVEALNCRNLREYVNNVKKFIGRSPAKDDSVDERVLRNVTAFLRGLFGRDDEEEYLGNDEDNDLGKDRTK